MKRMNTSDRSAMFLLIIDMLWEHDKEKLKDLAYEADVSPTTITNWMKGKTIAPRIDTLIKVSGSLGFTIGLKKVRKNKLKLVK